MRRIRKVKYILSESDRNEEFKHDAKGSVLPVRHRTPIILSAYIWDVTP